MDRILGFDSQFVIQVICQLLSTAVCIGVLNWLLYKPVKDFMQKRSERIQNTLDSANEALSSAMAMKHEYEKKLLGIDKKKNELLDKAALHADNMREKIITEAKKDAVNIKARASVDINRQRAKLRDEMKQQVINISWLVANNFMRDNINDSLHEKLVEEAIEQLGEL